MIAVDTSALMAIIGHEPEGRRCMAALEADPELLISAGTVAEALSVAGRRGVLAQMSRLIDGLGFEVIPVTAASAHRVAAAYDRWGKGVHPAGPNFGDCFAYCVAQERSSRLLFVGDDFSRTDLVGVS